jgi:hypothetical protein
MTGRIPSMGGLPRLSDAEISDIECNVNRPAFWAHARRINAVVRLCAEVRMLRAIVGADTLARMEPGEERSQ